MPVCLLEKQVLDIWRGSLQGRTDLVTAENDPIKIIYPGRPNDDRGADLRDAVIASAHGILKGDIEIHVKSSSWWTHLHHLDPVYNRVILHVVYRDDAARPIVLENGDKVPTLALQSYIGPCTERDTSPVPSSARLTIPCSKTVHSQNILRVNQILADAGEQRFLSHAAGFQEMITQSGAGQALYRGIMTALGYSKNTAAMTELADRLPLPRLAAAVTAGATESECLAQYQARLLGTAGLLPSQRRPALQTDFPADAWTIKLENIWVAVSEKSAMYADNWHFFKVRPGNHPVRRLAAMSYLLLRYRDEGLLVGLLDIIKEAAINKASRSLEEALLVHPDSFWGRYLDFNMPAQGTVPALLGRERAAEIAVNVLLPFAAAAGLAGAPPDFSSKAGEIYRSYPAAAENTLVKHMRKQLSLGRGIIDTACRQQGLIHIYKTRCSQGKCDECSLNPAMSDTW